MNPEGSKYYMLFTAINFLAEYLLILFFFARIPNRRENTKRLLSLSVLVLISLLYFSPSTRMERLQAEAGFDFLVQAERLCYYFLVVWVYLLYGKDRSARVCAYLSLYYVSFYGISRIYLILVRLLNNYLVSQGYESAMVELGLRVTVLAIEYGTALLVRRFVPLERIVRVSPFRVILVSGISLLSVFFRCSMISVVGKPQISSLSSEVVFPFFTAIAFTLFLMMFESWQAVEEERKQLAMQKALRSYELQLSEESAETSRQVQQLYHDMKNHLLAIRSMDHNTTEVQDYVDTILGKLEPYEAQVHTGIPYMDAYVSEKTREMKKMQVRQKIALNLTDLKFVEPVDLISIIGNCMDNAVEALHKVQSEDRVFTATSSRFANTVLLHFVNSYSGELVWEGELPPTQKEDKENHGIGLRTVQKTVGQYGGSVSIDLDKGHQLFKLTVLIPII